LTRKTKQDVVSEFRCAGILEAARRTFASRGFRAATMDEIAQAAGVAKGTLYLYFSSKQAIYLKALEHGLLQMLERTKERVHAAEGIRAKIGAFVETRVRYAEENRDFYRIYAESSDAAVPGSINKDFQKLYKRQVETFEQVLREAVNRGEIRPLPVRTTAFTIYDMTRSLIIRRLLSRARADIEEDIRFLREFIWTGIGNHEDRESIPTTEERPATRR
jgi:AcrR family transcriptional regulator